MKGIDKDLISGLIPAKSIKQEVYEILISNAGNRLTSELIAGLNARLQNVIEKAIKEQQPREIGEKCND
ncbi:hypothetical protein [Vibrio porteresiae]|uniref:Uncharacterized protein n=1 Tax=Vibrio porteresiae DSM 19223 TaxID=1123496 RepID=A0ABZ0Q8Y8_9VIBR|nr:hypothetical protein [Vibrio porteresiae]WPC72912.1 hypothetical protein R8Z52_12330 [Vibrio porteresiae DSM 19223]